MNHLVGEENLERKFNRGFIHHKNSILESKQDFSYLNKISICLFDNFVSFTIVEDNLLTRRKSIFFEINKTEKNHIQKIVYKF